MIGGAAVTEEIVPGFRFSVFSYLMSLLHPKVIADLELRSHGFEVLPATDMFGPMPGGNHIVFSDSVEKTQQSFARFSREGRGGLSRVRSLPDGIGGDPAQDPARDAAGSVVPRLEVVQADGGVSVEVPPDPAASCSASSISSR